MRRHMDQNKATYLKLTSSYSRIANYWKYYIGQTEQLKRLKVVSKKRAAEDEFVQWQKENGKDVTLLPRYAKAYENYTPYAKHYTYYTEAFRASAFARMGSGLKPLYDAYQRHNGKLSEDTLKKYTTMAQAAYRANLKEFDLATEKELLAEMTKLFYQNVPKEQQPDIYEKVIFKNYGKSYPKYADYVATHTFFTDSNKFNTFLKSPSMEQMKQDAAVQYALSFANNFSNNYQSKIDAFTYTKADLAKEYVKELMEENSDKLFYPDANSTMRITYGQVRSYEPQDGVRHKYFTTLGGLIAKYKPNDAEFDVPKELIALYEAKDYGRYTDADGTLHTCFITNNDITGGNSGSPVINAYGELIGTAFDGNWEAMSGDIAFDKKYKRTIVCDIRFILFLIDKMGHADNLIKEMDIRE
jgi:hypothetical protein